MDVASTTTELHAATVTKTARVRMESLHLYITAVVAVAALFAPVLWYLQLGFGRGVGGVRLGPGYSVAGLLAGTLFFLCVSVFADRFSVKFGGAEVSAGFLADFLSAALLGPLSGAVVAAAAFFVGDRRGAWQRTLFNSTAFFLVGGTTGIVYWGIQSIFGKSGFSLAAGGLAAGGVYFVLNFLLYAPVAWFRRGLGPRGWFAEAFGPFLPFHMFFLTLSLGLIFSFERLGPPGFVLFFLPVMGLVYAFRTFSNQRELARSLERFSLQMAASMITALDLKDNYTAQHSAAVAQYSFDTAAALKMSQKERSVAHLAGLLHDLGKISVPDEILNSRERLGAEEWAVIQGHSSAGQSVVSNMHEFEELGNIIRHHHERYDGLGYPDGVASDRIPLISRIVAVADSYSAMVSKRPYSAKLRPEEAIAELQAKAGTQFDPRVVNAFLDVLQGATMEYRRAEQLDFRLQFQKARFLGEIA